MQSSRTELMFWESGAVACAAAYSLGGLTPEEFIPYFFVDREHSTLNGVNLERDGYFLSPVLYQDDAFLLRVVVGELNDQEAGEWVARSSGKLNLTDDGRIMLCSAYDWFQLDDWADEIYPNLDRIKDGSMVETCGLMEVPTGLYQAVFYSYLPGDLSQVWDERLPDGTSAGSIAAKNNYARRHCGDALPECATSGESPDHYVDLILHLRPVDQATFDTLPISDTNVNFGWETRRPEICLRGIISAHTWEQ